MEYQDRMVVVVEVGGKVLREHDGAVRLPFGSDYGLRLKNMNSRRAVVSVSVDGEDVLTDNQIVVEPDDDVCLAGFMEANGQVRRQFRFIQKTDDIVKHRGDRLDDGMIRVEFRYERPEPETRRVETVHRDYYDWPPPRPVPVPWVQPWPYPGVFWNCTSPLGKTFYSSSASHPPMTTGASTGLWTNVECSHLGSPAADEGITVRGGRAGQSFRSVDVGDLETGSGVIVLRLRGTGKGGDPVKAAVTTRRRVPCPTCGRKSGSGAEFCSKCGTSLMG